MSKRQLAASLPFFLCIAMLLATGATPAGAQAGRGSISGLVTDPSGAVVPATKVTALNRSTGIAQSTVTTAGGLYSFVSLNPGIYQVTAAHKGFESVAEDNVSVSVDQVTGVNIALRIGSVSDTLTVSASVDLLDTSNSTVGQLISAETIDRVPLVNRNVYDLVQLSAGVAPANGSPNSSNSEAIINISSGRPGVDVSSYSINGAILGSVYYMLDGSPLGIAENNIAAIIPMSEIPEDGVDEYARRDAKHASQLPERRRRRHQPRQQVRRRQVSWRRLRRLPARHPGRQRLLQQAGPAARRGSQCTALVPSLPGRRIHQRTRPAQEAFLLRRL